MKWCFQTTVPGLMTPDQYAIAGSLIPPSYVVPLPHFNNPEFPPRDFRISSGLKIYFFKSLEFIIQSKEHTRAHTHTHSLLPIVRCEEDEGVVKDARFLQRLQDVSYSGVELQQRVSKRPPERSAHRFPPCKLWVVSVLHGRTER